MLCQPVRKENVEVVFGGIRVFSGDQGERTVPLEGQQDNSFSHHQSQADPDPHINFIADYSVQKVKDDHVVEDPDECVNPFDKEQPLVSDL